MTKEKTGGRTKGTKNKITSELRSSLKDIVYNELENLPNILNKMNDETRLSYVIKLLPFVMPKVENIKMDRNEPTNYNFKM